MSLRMWDRNIFQLSEIIKRKTDFGHLKISSTLPALISVYWFCCFRCYAFAPVHLINSILWSLKQTCGLKKLHVYHLAFTLHRVHTYTQRARSRSVSLHIRMPSACLLLCDYIQQPLGCKLPKPTHFFLNKGFSSSDQL